MGVAPPTPPATPLVNGVDAPATPILSAASTDLAPAAAPAESPIAAAAAPAPEPAPAAEEPPAAAPIAVADETPAPAPEPEAPAAAEAEPAAAAPPAGLGAALAAAVNDPKPPEEAPAAAAADDQDIYTVPTNNKAAPLPTGVLKRVLATHPYTAEDEDELSFAASDVFCVLPYEDPEEAGGKEKIVDADEYAKESVECAESGPVFTAAFEEEATVGGAASTIAESRTETSKEFSCGAQGAGAEGSEVTVTNSEPSVEVSVSEAAVAQVSISEIH